MYYFSGVFSVCVCIQAGEKMKMDMQGYLLDKIYFVFLLKGQH